VRGATLRGQHGQGDREATHRALLPPRLAASSFDFFRRGAQPAFFAAAFQLRDLMRVAQRSPIGLGGFASTRPMRLAPQSASTEATSEPDSDACVFRIPRRVSASPNTLKAHLLCPWPEAGRQTAAASAQQLGAIVDRALESPARREPLFVIENRSRLPGGPCRPPAPSR
jgi:hypothetical protein